MIQKKNLGYSHIPKNLEGLAAMVVGLHNYSTGVLVVTYSQSGGEVQSCRFTGELVMTYPQCGGEVKSCRFTGELVMTYPQSGGEVKSCRFYRSADNDLPQEWW